jgi:hypothetical protein
MAGWVILKDVKKVLADSGVDYKFGEHENRTDGEAHWICKKGDKAYEFSGNYYDGDSFRSLIEWAKT